MKHFLVLAGAAALGFTAPAFAHPGNGHGQGHGPNLGYEHYGRGSLYGYGIGGCPPGLAKKNPPCVPPGIAKQQFVTGQRFVPGGLSRYDYGRIPYELRAQYGLNPYERYYYGDGYLYGVDPRTMLVQHVVGALLGRY